MTKTKKSNVYSPLIISGYILFALLLLSVVLSTTIPFGRMLFVPRVIHLNAAIFMIALTVGALLPALVGYSIGNNSIKSKKKSQRHFNGVLFGVLTYWVTVIVASPIATIISEQLAGKPNLRTILINVIPSVVVAAIAALLSVSHLRSKQASKDIIEYKPFSVALIAAVALFPLSIFIDYIISDIDIVLNLYTFIPAAIVLIFGGISYGTLHKKSLSTLHKVIWSAISVSIAFIASLVFSQFVIGVSYYLNSTPSMEVQTIINSIGWILALAAWIVYWRFQVKSFSRRQ